MSEPWRSEMQALAHPLGQRLPELAPGAIEAAAGELRKACWQMAGEGSAMRALLEAFEAGDERARTRMAHTLALGTARLLTDQPLDAMEIAGRLQSSLKRTSGWRQGKQGRIEALSAEGK